MTVKFALITPLKNEEDNVIRLKETVLSQTIVPDLWVVVVADSSDKTLEKCQSSLSDLPFVRIIKQTEYSSKHWNISFAIAVNDGIRHIENNGEFKYIAKVDASIVLNKDYFEVLINELETDNDLMFVCGRERFLNMDENTIPLQPNNDGIIGMNDNRMYRTSFLNNVGGYPLTPCPDTVLIVKNTKAGNKNKVVNKTGYIEPRVGSSKDGIWDGYFQWEEDVYIELSSSFGFNKFFIFSIKFKPHYQGIALILGYFNEFVNRESKIMDEEVKTYFIRKD